MTNRTSWFRIGVSCAIALGILFGAQPVFAVPAAPDIHRLSQPDGSEVRAVQWGDENLHGWETKDGYTIVYDAGLKSWTYAVKGPDGSLVSSGRIAGRDAVPEGLSKQMRPSPDFRATLPTKSLAREAAPAAAPAPRKGMTKSGTPGEPAADMPQKVVPPVGTANVPVILVNFSNTSTTYGRIDFDGLLFSGSFSMKDFYQEVSYGEFSIAPGAAGINGWYMASNTHDYYGANDGSGNDLYPGQLVKEAVMQADASVDFSAYDNDGNCYVDVVEIVHQGTGEEASGVAADIWSHRWSLGGSGAGAYTTNDVCSSNPGMNVIVNDYVIQPEVQGAELVTMGVFAHEYGHALGLPDLYDTDYTSRGVGRWSLMAGGSWNYATRSGDRPAHPDAWSKYRLGWVTPTLVSGPMPSEVVSAASGTVADVYQLLDGAPLSGEYFLVENRQQSGFDVGLPGAGLLVWHIDGSYIASHSSAVNRTECYPPADCSVNHYGVALVQADNAWELEKNLDSGDAADPFASPGNSEFSGASAPSSALYSGAASDVTITNISASGAAMTASFGTPASVFVLNEGFDSGSLPAGWTVVNNVGAAGWRFDNPGSRTNYTGGTGLFAAADSDNAGSVPMDTELITPALDLSGAETASLKFRTDFWMYSGSEIADVDVSTNGGTSWTNMLRMTADLRTSPVELDITSVAAGEANVKVRFHYYNVNYDWWWQVDDVKVQIVPVVLSASAAQAGVFRGNGSWLLDVNGSGAWDGGDSTIKFGIAGDIPVTGDWNGDGTTDKGVFRGNGRWLIDSNGNGTWEPGTDAEVQFGMTGDIPVTGDWNGDGVTDVGVFRGNGKWYLDTNGSRTWELGVDGLFKFGMTGDLPVTGDWDGDGTTEIGVFRGNGYWYLDTNGNRAWNAGVDSSFKFGISGDIPVTGDWNGDGTTETGLFRGSGSWYLDTNGNRAWNAGIDTTFKFGIAGDIPVTGNW